MTFNDTATTKTVYVIIYFFLRLPCGFHLQMSILEEKTAAVCALFEVNLSARKQHNTKTLFSPPDSWLWFGDTQRSGLAGDIEAALRKSNEKQKKLNGDYFLTPQLCRSIRTETP